MKKYLILFTAICFYQPSFAQIMWQYSYGGSWPDWGNSIAQTPDGGYIIAATTWSNDGDVSGNHDLVRLGDYWVAKLSVTGSLQWQKCFGGSREDIAASIAPCSDGGYIVAGESKSNDGDVSGNHGDEDFWVVKLSAVGDIEWQKSLGGSQSDNATSIIQTFDGGFMVVGPTVSTDGDVACGPISHAWIVKLSPSGSIQWQKCIGDNTHYTDAVAVIQTADSGYMIAGSSDVNDSDIPCNHGNNDFMIVKLSSSGSILWQKCYGGSLWDDANCMAQTTDGGFVVAGSTSSNDGDVSGNPGSWVIKLSPVGALQWQQCYGGYAAYSVAAATDGGSIVSALSNGANWIFKLSASGSMDWQTYVGNVMEAPAFGSCIMQSSDGNYVFTGAIKQDSGYYGNVYVVKFGPNVGVPNVSQAPAISVFPNPTTGPFTITLPPSATPATITITNLLGSTIETRTIQNTQPQNVEFNLHTPPGAYLIQVTTGANSWRQKIEVW
jgi:type IX secretion system substrate protein